MQLVAYGAQDIYLTGNPQITFFKVVYRRHTNFSMESIQQTINGTAAAGAKVSTTISRNGDLVYRMYLEYTVDCDNNDMNSGHHGIDSIELEIGGQQIDKHYGHWLETWVELTEPNPTGLVIDADSGGTGTKYQNMAYGGGVLASNTDLVCAVPFQFWFCRNPGLALPLIALQYHEVKTYVTFAPSSRDLAPSSVSIWADYIYLDTDERRRFAQVSHEYLIEQLQYFQTSEQKPQLNFNHPVKELIWTGGITAGTGVRAALQGTNYKLVLNGHDRFAARPLKYFCSQQVWQHHTGTPIQAGSAVGELASLDEIAVYSFALKPEEHQPSGTCNFSRIDNAKLEASDTATTNMNVYAVNYNVLRIMSGMGGLAYSN